MEIVDNLKDKAVKNVFMIILKEHSKHPSSLLKDLTMKDTYHLALKLK